MRKRYPAIAVDVVLFKSKDKELQVLLIQRKNPPFKNKWVLPGGFVEEDEPLETAARRELQEETGVKGVKLKQFHTFGDPHRDPRGRVVSVAHLAITKKNINPKPASDAKSAEWFSIEDLPSLGFDHRKILKLALQKLEEM